MARKTPIQIVGGAYSDDALPWTAQDCVNYIPVFAEKAGTRSPKMLRGAPGHVLFSADCGEAPVRGLHDCEGIRIAVVGTTAYRIASDGTATALGTVPGVERVTIAHNQISGGHEIAIGNGQSGYVYNTADGTFGQITDDAFPGFRSVDFIDQYIIGVEPFGRYWFHSDLSDATSYSSIDRMQAEKQPDGIQQAIATGGDVFVLGKRSAQFFSDTGASTGTFANRPGTEMDVGAASPWTACRLDNSVFWLSNEGIVYKLEGYQPRRVSTHALEQALSRADISKAFAFTFEDHGHKVYYLTVGGKTWGFDVATGEWHRRKSAGLDFWRMNNLVRWGRRWYGGDYTNGRLYLLDWRVQDEAGEELERGGVCPVIHDDQNRIVLNLFELLFDTGMDAESFPLPDVAPIPLSITGDVPDGYSGDSVSTTYVATGGVQPATFTVQSGTTPPGLTFHSDGTVDGTFTTGGSYSWVMLATDMDGNTATLADTAVVESASTLYDQVTYTGDGTASRNIATTVDLTGGGLVIIMRDSVGAVGLYSTDGVTVNKIDMANSSGATVSAINGFGSATFTLVSEGTVGLLNASGGVFTAHVFKRAARFFDIVRYAGTAAANTVPHALGVAPGMTMLQAQAATTPAYVTYLKTLGIAKGFALTETPAPSASARTPFSVAPDASDMRLTAAAFQNQAATEYVAFLWADDASGTGVIRNVMWTGTGVAGNTVTSAGWQPQSILGRADASSNVFRFIGDDFNASFTGNEKQVFPTTTAADTSADVVGLATNGFQLNSTTVWNAAAVVHHAMVLRKP